MMASLGNYSFLPWLRQGLANQITAADFDGSVKLRASVTVKIEARGEKPGGGQETLEISKPVALYGPGDIVGIDRRAFFRLEPREGATNFEPNHLAHIEFQDEDLAWRYTPAAPDAKGRLRPWIALVVLAETEFKDGADMKDKPLPYVDVANLSVFPRADELWAWAHVHVNRSLAGSDNEFFTKDMAAVMPRLQAVLAENPDLGYARLLCPRKLAESTAYHAFLMPVFESGRRAGLGLDLADVSATASAWEAPGRPQGQSFPYYFRWAFNTGAAGDFETLVKLLVPKPVDPRVGRREMDVQAPGSNVRPVDNPLLGGILQLGGALLPPADVPPKPPTVQDTWDAPFPRPLQTDLAHLINLPDDYQSAGDPDPIIAPPLYGRWHALTQRVLEERNGTPVAVADNWIHRLNLDPRFRVAAGTGTRVIQDQQEKYMDAAWEQIGSVLEAKQRIRFGQFGLLASLVWHERHLAPTLAVSRQQTLLLMAPLAKRIVVGGSTVHHAMAQSLVQPAMTSAALRRIVRPRARLMKALPFDAAITPAQLIDRVNAGEVSAAPPKTAPPGVQTADEAANKVLPANAPPLVVLLLRRHPWLPLAALALALFVAVLLWLLLPPLAGIAAALAAVAAGAFLYRLLRRWAIAVQASQAVPLGAQTPASIDALPGVPDFVIADVGSGFVPGARGTDSVEAARFKLALRDTLSLVQAAADVGRLPMRRSLDLSRIAGDGLAAIGPSRTIPRRVMATIDLPARLAGDIVVAPGQVFVEPMAYPVIDQPMYEPLKNLSAELFLPNIDLIEHNSITLLQTNQRFIESYMVGLNHEFARELLWREYPTDQRGSSFRQFWDARGAYNSKGLDAEAFRESLRDIPPLHMWSQNSALGDHDHRESGRDNEEELVLVIRGELLKRYPNAVIYAHRACWQRAELTPADAAKDPCSKSGPIDNTVERRFSPLTAAQELDPPPDKVLTPLYEAKVDPDIYFFGFDLTVAQAKGGTGEHPNDDPGWFFVIKERPGEPRFGLDIEQAPMLQVWNDLSWPLVQPKPAGSHIEIATAPAQMTVANPGTSDEKYPQYQDDVSIKWSRAAMTSAELAYMLFQAPVLVGVHAVEMLSK